MVKVRDISLATNPRSHLTCSVPGLGRLQFGGAEEEKIKQAVGTFCSNQPFALEIIKTKQKKDSRFTSFIQVPRPPFTSCRLLLLFFFLKGLRRSHEDGTRQMAMAPFQRKFHFLESKPPAAFTFAHTPTPERGKKKKNSCLVTI